MNKRLLLCLLSVLTVTTLSLPASATLIDNGGGLIYDTVLDITWLQNANLAASNTFGLNYDQNYGNDIYGNPSIIFSSGQATWGGAEAWIAAMNKADYLGHNTWALPTTPVSCQSYYCTSSQMGELYYTEGGQSALWSITGSPTLMSKFTNMQNSGYWSGTEYAPNTNLAWGFNASYGEQGYGPKGNGGYAWAVLSGNASVAAVPEADEWAMLLAGLGLVGIVVRRRHE